MNRTAALRELPPLPAEPRVVVVIPCRNERDHIGRCLESLVDSDMPKERIAVRVCDGMSDDGTRDVVASFSAKHPWIALVDNPHRTTPHALNIGLRMGGYDVAIILGAHSTVAPDMVRRNVEVLAADRTAGCAGGIIENVYDNAMARRIGAAMGHPFGVGNAHFRTGRKAGPVDTVAFGAYRKEVFDAVGYFDEELVRNQDDEFNYRVTRAGLRIVLDPTIRSQYYVRSSLSRLFRQYDQYGYWKVYVNRKHRVVTTWRQVVPALWTLFLIAAPLALARPALRLAWLAGFGLYLVVALISSMMAAARPRDVGGVFVAFLTLHVAYGIGYLKGVVHLVMLRGRPGERSRALTRGAAEEEGTQPGRSLFAAHGPWAGTLLALLALGMSLWTAAVPALLVAAGIALVVHHAPAKGPRSSPAPGSVLLWSLALYALYLLGLLWSTDMGYAWFDLGIKASMGLVPLVLWVVPDRSRVGGRTLLSAFVGGAVLATVVCLVVAGVRTVADVLPGGPGFWSGHWIASRFSLFMHPSYYAMHLCLALAVVLLREHRPGDRGYRLATPFLLVVGILFSGSKAGWGALVLLYLVLLVVRWRTPQRRVMLLAGLVGISVFAMSVQVSPFMREKVDQLIAVQRNGPPAPNATGSSEVRQLTWQAAGELLREHWLLGTGTGDVKNELVDRYAAKGYEEPLARRLNAHSQLLQTPLTLGVLGGVLIAMLLLLPMLVSLRERDTVGALFIALLLLNWSVESMLEVQAGVVFLAVVGLLLALRGPRDANVAPRLVLLTQYFPPETGAPQNRLHAIATALAAQGVEVTVLTGMPNYPEMVVHEGYRGAVYRCERMDGLEVRRAWLHASTGKGLLARLSNYFSFVFSALWVGLCELRRSDLLLVESPPLFLGITAMGLARAKGAALIFNVSDLWPESAVQLGLVRNRALIAASTVLEESCYRRSALITGQTKGIVNDIARRMPGKQVRWVPNGVDLPAIAKVPATPGMREALGIPREAVVCTYAGIIGHAQGLGTIAQAAEQLVDTNVLFLLVGEGPVKAGLQAMVNDKGLRNVRFLERMPRARVLGLVQESDAVVVPLRRNDLFKGAIPSKIFEALALGRPLLLGVDGEARDLFIREGDCGLYFEPEDPSALALAVRRYIADPALRARHGENGARYVREHFDRAVISRALWSDLQQVLQRRAGRG